MSKVLEDKLNSIEHSVHRIGDATNKQAVTLERLTVTVETHVKRCDLLEDQQKTDKKQIEEQIAPLRKFMDMALGALKLLTAIGLGALIRALYG
jgi:hypothetical protein